MHGQRMREYEEWVHRIWGDSSENNRAKLDEILVRMLAEVNDDTYTALEKLLKKHEELRMLGICTLGLNEEAGEVTGPIKKWIRNPIKHPMDADMIEHIVDEAGDVLYYLVKILGWVGSSLDEAMTANESKINVRYNGDECPRCLNADPNCKFCKGANYHAE